MATERARYKADPLPEQLWDALVEEAAAVLATTRPTLSELAGLEVVERDALLAAAQRLETERALLRGAAVTRPHLVGATVDGGEAHDEAIMAATLEAVADRVKVEGV